MLKVNAECFSIEAANPQHDTDYHVWEATKLPDGKCYMPGVVSHVSNHIEHPAARRGAARPLRQRSWDART